AKTRLKQVKRNGLQSDKSNLADSAAFGQFLVTLCRAFTSETLRGPLPYVLHLPNGAERHWPRNMSRGNSRPPLHPHQNISDQGGRSVMANLRIQAELAIFIAQSGMNYSQASMLQRMKIRWKNDDDDVLAFRVYKDRREGEAV